MNVLDYDALYKKLKEKDTKTNFVDTRKVLVDLYLGNLQSCDLRVSGARESSERFQREILFRISISLRFAFPVSRRESRESSSFAIPRLKLKKKRQSNGKITERFCYQLVYWRCLSCNPFINSDLVSATSFNKRVNNFCHVRALYRPITWNLVPSIPAATVALSTGSPS